MSSKNTSINLKRLELIAMKLGELNEDIVYLGGCTTAVFITDPLLGDVRPTIDVDCIIDVISLADYHQFSKKLSKKGFKPSPKDDTNCRLRCDDIILDVIPTNEAILGFGNSWNAEAIKHFQLYKFSEDIIIKVVSAPYFLATKIEAFKNRGNNDFLGSHDLEDILIVISGRDSIVSEVLSSNDLIKTYIKTFFENLLKNTQFEVVLPGHLNEGRIDITMQKVQIVMERIKKIISG